MIATRTFRTSNRPSGTVTLTLCAEVQRAICLREPRPAWQRGGGINRSHRPEIAGESSGWRPSHGVAKNASVRPHRDAHELGGRRRSPRISRSRQPSGSGSRGVGLPSAVSLCSFSGVLVGATAIQYIITTTSNPPAEIQSSDCLVQKLSGSSVNDRLLRCDLG
jgi:hypothetical protein